MSFEKTNATMGSTVYKKRDKVSQDSNRDTCKLRPLSVKSVAEKRFRYPLKTAYFCCVGKSDLTKDTLQQFAPDVLERSHYRISKIVP